MSSGWIVLAAYLANQLIVIAFALRSYRRHGKVWRAMLAGLAGFWVVPAVITLIVGLLIKSGIPREPGYARAF